MNWVDKLIDYYAEHARSFPWRTTNDPYSVWISEIMLQQTRTETVISYYKRFIEQYPTVTALAGASDSDLFKSWEGLGYYSRAKNLRKAAQIIVNDHLGVFPEDYQSILALPGIGPYTAGAVASIAYGLPYPAVDGNVLRVYTRLFADEMDIAQHDSKETVNAFLSEIIPTHDPGSFNQALMDLGATICLPHSTPKCELCPLNGDCKAHKLGIETHFPVKTSKRKRKVICKTVFVLKTESGIIGYLRNEPGLLSGLYQLPDIQDQLALDQAMLFLKENSISVNGELLQYKRKHLFTHIEWDMLVYQCSVYAETLPDGWIILNADKHALPTAYKKCIDAATFKRKEKLSPESSS